MPYIGNVTTSSNVNGSQINNGTITGDKLSLPFDYDSATLYLDGVNNRVGIGTTSPGTTLAVAGGISGTAGANISGAGWGVLPYVANSLVIDNNAGETRFFATGADATTKGSFIFYNGETDGGTTTAMVIDTSSRVGIGTNAPGYSLDIVGNQRITNSAGSTLTVNRTSNPGSISWQHSGTETGQIAAVSGGGLNFYTGSTPTLRATLDNSGRVGIGTTSPDGNLTIGGLTNTGGESVDAINVNRTDGVRLFGVKWDVTSNEVRFSGNTKNYVFRNGSSEAETVRIDSSGRLLVGTSSAATTDNNANSPNIQLEGADGDASRLLVRSNAGTTATAGPIIYLSRSRGTTANSKTSVAADDLLGSFVFEGTDGTADRRAASISAFVDGTPGASDMPGRLVFSTTADGAASPTERFRISSTGAQSSVIPGGSTLYPSFDCRAWVNFNGTGTVAIRASGNVSSITDNGTGDYTVNFTTALADANYSLVGSSSNGGQGTNDEYTGISAYGTNSYLAGSVRIGCVRWRYDVQVMFDAPIVSVSIFR